MIRTLWTLLMLLVLVSSASGFGVITGAVKANSTTNPSCPTTYVDGSGATIPVGVGCFAANIGSCPSETGVHDPINYGADKNGVGDSGPAVASAYNAGTDIFFGTAGTYKIANPTTATTIDTAHGIVPPANTKFECAPGVTILNPYSTSPTGVPFFSLSLENGGNTICGCTFAGASNNSGPANLGDQAEDLIEIESNNNVIEDNTIINSTSDAAIATSLNYGPRINAPSNNIIRFNSGSHNALFMFNTDNATGTNINNGTQLLNNDSVDGQLGVEYDGCTNVAPAVNQYVLVKHNRIGVLNGSCRNGGNCVGSGPATMYITADSWPPGCSYSTNQSVDNYCSGTASVAGQYYNNGSQLGFANSSCTGLHTPYACCSQSGAGTCAASGNAATYNNDVQGPHCNCLIGSSC